MNCTAINHTTATALHLALQAALNDFAEANGLKADTGRATFDSEKLTVKVALLLPEAQTREEKDWESCRFIHEIDRKVGDTVDFGTRGKLTIVGFKSRATKRPVLMRDEQDRMFVFPVDAIQRAIRSGG